MKKRSSWPLMMKIWEIRCVTMEMCLSSSTIARMSSSWTPRQTWASRNLRCENNSSWSRRRPRRFSSEANNRRSMSNIWRKWRSRSRKRKRRYKTYSAWASTSRRPRDRTRFQWSDALQKSLWRHNPSWSGGDPGKASEAKLCQPSGKNNNPDFN